MNSPSLFEQLQKQATARSANNTKVQSVFIVDSHTGGEPTRMVIAGFPEVHTQPTKNQGIQSVLNTLKKQHDQWRQAVILEPRGHEAVVGALLTRPTHPEADLGVIFFNNQGYLGMCGHGTIGVIASLAYLGVITEGSYTLETPVGLVKTQLHADGSVSLDNVPAYRYAKDVQLDVPGVGAVVGDIAWGGNWFFLVKQPSIEIDIRHADHLVEVTMTIKSALTDQGITGADGGEIDHIELFQDHHDADSQNFVLCPGGVYDRSPCGTGTSAKIACLAADGILQEGQVWNQAGILHSQFQATYKRHPTKAGYVLPTIQGRAYVTQEGLLLLHEDDPFRWGITDTSTDVNTANVNTDDL